LINITVSSDHTITTDSTILGRSLENAVETLSFAFPSALNGLDVYLEFQRSNGEKYISAKLTGTTYIIPSLLLTEQGKLFLQVVGRGTEIVWKSEILELCINQAINALIEFPDTTPDWFQDVVSATQNAELAAEAAFTDPSVMAINPLFPPNGLSPIAMDGATDDSANLQAIINYLILSGGGTLYIPRGTCKCNISIVTANANIQIKGAGQSASVLSPYDTTKPVIAIGDGITQTTFVRIESLKLLGDGVSNTSDGLYINSAMYCNFVDLYITYFGRNNISITTTGSVSTMFLYFLNIKSKVARGSCLKMDYGTKWVTSVYFENLVIESYSTITCTAIDLTGSITLNLTNAWIQVYGSKKGHIVLRSSSANIRGVNVKVDSDVSSDVLVYMDIAPTVITGNIKGEIGIDGKIEFNDGSQVACTSMGYFVPYGSHLNYPVIDNLILTDSSKTVAERESSTSTNAMRIYNSSGKLLVYPTGSGGADLRTILQFLPVSGANVLPTTSGSPGIHATVMFDPNNLYIATATNSWKKAPLTILEVPQGTEQFITVADSADTYTLDVKLNLNFAITIGDTNAKTIVFSNVTNLAGSLLNMTIKIDYANTASITFPANITWAVAPSFTEGKKYVFELKKYQGVTNWYGKWTEY
jgi:hypothetical protein